MKKYVVMTSGWEGSGDWGRYSDKLYDTKADATEEIIEALFDKGVQDIWIDKIDTEEGDKSE